MSVFAATKEEAVDTDDFQAGDLTLAAMRDHTASLITLSMEAIAQRAPDVAFVHDEPGPVHSGIGHDYKGCAVAATLIVQGARLAVLRPGRGGGRAGALSCYQCSICTKDDWGGRTRGQCPRATWAVCRQGC